MYVNIEIAKKQASLCKVEIKVIKVLLKVSISKFFKSIKQRKLARCCKAASYRYKHCTCIRAGLRQKGTPASAKASTAKGLKAGTVVSVRKRTDLTSKDMQVHIKRDTAALRSRRKTIIKTLDIKQNEECNSSNKKNSKALNSAKQIVLQGNKYVCTQQDIIVIKEKESNKITVPSKYRKNYYKGKPLI